MVGDSDGSSIDIGAFYDQYVDRQTAVGVNERHHAILSWLNRAGLRSEHRVLEIGCGVGTLTELLAARLSQRGALLATDISPRSIEVARQRLARYGHIQLVAGDIFDLDVGGPYDVIVLPDVVEHIPLERHAALFERLASWIAPHGFVLLHYPNPYYLAWCREHTPEVLQVIDQPIRADTLLANACPHGLYLDFLQTYSIWIREGDYVVAVLRPESGIDTFTPKPEKPVPISRKLLRRVRRTLK
jgi:trans-aconitate 2-methyltransferase